MNKPDNKIIFESQTDDDVMPHSLEAEQAVLGKILYDGDSIAKIVDILKPEDFYGSANQKIYRTAIGLYRNSTPVDMTLLGEELKRLHELDKVGGFYYLTQLCESAFSSANIEHYAKIIIEKSILRKRIELCNRLIENSKNGADQGIHDKILSQLNEMHSFVINKPIELSEMPDPGPILYVVQDIIPKDFTTNLYGDSGQGKSWVALRIAASVINGTSIFNKKVEQGKVLYLDWELNESVQKHRWRQISRGMGYSSCMKGLYYRKMSGPFYLELPHIMAWIRELKPGLIVIDSVGKALCDDPLDPVRIVRFYNECEKFGTVLLIDHQPKPSGEGDYTSKWEYGSSYKRNMARSSWQLQKLDTQGQKSGYVLRQKKNNFGPIVEDIHFEMSFSPNGVEFNHASSADQIAQKPFGLRTELLNILQKGPATSEEIAQSLDGAYKDGAIRNEIASFKREGKIVITAKKNRFNVYGLRAYCAPPYRDMHIMHENDSEDGQNEPRPF